MLLIIFNSMSFFFLQKRSEKTNYATGVHGTLKWNSLYIKEGQA